MGAGLNVGVSDVRAHTEALCALINPTRPAAGRGRRLHFMTQIKQTLAETLTSKSLNSCDDAGRFKVLLMCDCSLNSIMSAFMSCF